MSGLTLREVLTQHYAASGLLPDGGRQCATWVIRVGRYEVRFKNFDWRRQALTLHDAHHVLTGYTCTLRGEFEMAAWEFAAGRFRRIGATLFCLPLIGIGFLAVPLRAYAAFERGIRSRSLYAMNCDLRVLDMCVEELRAAVFPPGPVSVPAHDRIRYAAGVAASLAWLALPGGVVVALVAALRPALA